MATNESRKYYLDFLRIFAAFWVVFNHTEGFHLYLSQAADGSLTSWLQVIVSVFTTVDIPIFYMVSGALLLGKEESYPVLFRKRILRMFAVLVVFSALIYSVQRKGSLFSMTFLRALFAGEVTLSYWFLFSYLGFLFCVPFLRKIARSMRNSDFFFLTAVQLILVGILPAYRHFSNALGCEPIRFRSEFQIPFSTLNILYYPLIGYHLSTDKLIGHFEKKHPAILLGTLALGVGLSSAVTYHQGITSGFSQDYIALFSSVTVISLFLLVRFVFERVSLPSGVTKFLRAFSGLTFGVYLLEPMLSYYLYYSFDYYFSPMVYSVIWCFFSVAVCSAITFLLKKLPLLGKIL